MTDDSEPDRGGIVRLVVLFEAGLAPLALGLGWLIGQQPLEGFSWNIDDAERGIAAALPLFALFCLGLRWPIGPLERIKRFCDEELVPILEDCQWHDLALMAVAAGVGEEMLFRGVIQAALGRWLGPGAGLALTSALFGLLHPITPAYILIAGVMGAYLGAVWMISGNLLTVIIAHALYDFLALWVLLSGWTEPGRDAE